MNTYCHKCGIAIKNIFEYNGSIYGSTCIEAVSGVAPDRWIWKDGKPSWEATELSIAEKEAKKAAQEQIRLENNKRYASLLVWLKSRKVYVGDYFWSMMDRGEKSCYPEPFTSYDVENMRDIYGKEYGRRGSKKYNQAVAEFDNKFNL